MRKVTAEDVQHMSKADQLDLVDDIMERIAHQQQVHKSEQSDFDFVQERLKRFKKSPDSFISLDELKRKVSSGIRSQA